MKRACPWLLLLAIPLLTGVTCSRNPSTSVIVITGREEPDAEVPGLVRPGTNVFLEYVIVPGDVLSIEGGKHQEITSDSVRVDEKGDINLLYIGKLRAASKSKSQLEKDIEEAYTESGKLTNPQVSVAVLTLYYYIDGQVRLPGKRPYLREITLYRAIVEAAGFTEFAAPTRVRVYRTLPGGQHVVYKINVKRIMRGVPDNFVIVPEDIIRVPKSVF